MLQVGGLEATCIVRLRLNGKPTMDFLLVTIEHFSGVMAEALQANID